MKDNQKIKGKPLKGKQKSFLSNKKVKWTALFLAVVLTGSGFALQRAKYRKMLDSLKPVSDDQNKNKLSPSLSFDPNNNQEMINRIAHIYTDALSKGVNNVSIEQWIDFYTVLNLNDIDVKDYARLENFTKTKDSMIRNFDYVANTLLDDTITSTPSTIIDIPSLIADKESADAVDELQKMIASFYTTSDKKEEAKKINAYIEQEFGTSNHKNVDAAVNVLRMKLILGTERVTINSSYRIPKADMIKAIFGNSKNCDDDAMANTVYNNEKTVVKQMLEEKLNQALNANIDNNEDPVELLTEFEIQMEIDRIIRDSNVKYEPNPDIKKVVEDHKPKDTKPTVKPTDKVKEDPKTGKTVIVETQTDAEKKAQQQEIQKQIDEENKKETLRAQGVQEGAQAGWNDGYADGYKGVKSNPNIGEISGDKIYADAFRQSYKEQYALGYKDGQAKLEREKNIIKNEEKPKKDKTIPSGSGDQMILGYNDGKEAGSKKGYEDGFYKKEYNESCSPKNYEAYKTYETYVEYYQIAYSEHYKTGYDEGKAARVAEDEKDIRELGEKAGAASGNKKGYEDGYNSRSYNDSCYVSGDKPYVEAYKEAYAKNYKKGYDAGKNKRILEYAEKGKTAGYEKGYNDGKNNRGYNSTAPIISSIKEYADAYKHAYVESYKDGYMAGQKDQNKTKNPTEENLHLNGQKDGARDGHNNGYLDGYNGNNRNDSLGNIPGEKAYREAYKKAYKESYEKGYNTGIKDRQKDLDQFKPIEKTNENNTNIPQETIIDVQFDFIEEGLEIGPDGKIYDKNGNEVIIINQVDINKLDKQELEQFKTIAMNIQNIQKMVQTEIVSNKEKVIKL